MNATRPIDDTYTDVEPLIRHIVGKTVLTMGGNFDDLLGIANLVFMDCYATFDDSKGNFAAYLSRSVRNKLIDVRCYLADRHQLLSLDAATSDGTTTYAAQVEDYRSTGDGFDLESFAETMTADAKAVIELALEAPADLMDLITGRGGRIINWRPAIRSWLAKQGWTQDRISKTFAEIKLTLSAAGS